MLDIFFPATDFSQIPWLDWLIQATILIIISVVICLAIVIAVAYTTLAERKAIAWMQLRRGPNIVGPLGLLQPIADAMKLMFKELIIPTKSNPVLFILAPVITFTLALIAWTVIPVGEGIVFADINVGLLYLFAISSLGVYGIIIAGWSSNSKYPFLSAIRSAAQMVSYEVSIGFVLITVLLLSGSMNLSDIVMAQKQVWFIIPLFPMFIIFFVSCLAETNRTPFDLAESESELVAGYMVEHSSMSFALFFLGEYANILLMCAMTTILFLGGWLPPFNIEILNIIPGPIWFFLKSALILFGFFWTRASLPRYRYDQLMRLGWKVFLPITLVYLIIVAATKLYLIPVITG